jgi:Cys/Met metabolism PLP-dependent enzyme
MRTLQLRLERATATAHELAGRLGRHTDVSTVRYPGLPTHPTHSTASRFMRSYGPMISLGVRGNADRADAICECLRIIRHATSLGSVETTIERRAAVPGQEHLPPTLLRLSVGCENVEDLWSDLDSALVRTRPWHVVDPSVMVRRQRRGVSDRPVLFQSNSAIRLRDLRGMTEASDLAPATEHGDLQRFT